MPDRVSHTRFGLIRHAQTVWNLEKMIQGQKDSPLTTAGREQSRIWGEQLALLPFNRILTSDLGRTVATAELINRSLKLPLQKTSLLRELDWGAWTGRRIQEIKMETPEELRSMEQSGWQFCPPGGESRRAVWLRSRKALEEAFKRWPGETILTVIHEGVIKCLLYGLAERQFLPQEPVMIEPRHLHWIVGQEKELRIEQINAISLVDKTAFKRH
jgi:probable phosphoglycerate mutase